MPVVLIARKTITSGDVERVVSAQLQIIETAMQAEGAISIWMCRDVDNPNVIVLYEEWESWELLTAWVNSEHIANYRREHEPEGTLEIDFNRLERIR